MAAVILPDRKNKAKPASSPQKQKQKQKTHTEQMKPCMYSKVQISFIFSCLFFAIFFLLSLKEGESNELNECDTIWFCPEARKRN